MRYSWAVGVVLFLAFTGLAAENEFCPVMPAEPASAEFTTEWNGRTVRFCCRSCVAKFRANPAAYSAKLAPESTFSDLAAVAPYLRLIGCGLGILTVVGLGLFARRAKPSAGGRVLIWASRPTTVAVWLLLAACVELGFRWDAAETALAESRATKSNAPPVNLLTWSWPQALHELPKGVSATYYRGNDERAPELFNGGKYRTVTFHLGLERPNGTAVSPGDMVGSDGVNLRFRFVRAAGTAPQFFRDAEMCRSAILPGSGQPVSPVPLTTVRPQWEWSAAVPLGAPQPTGDSALRGVWLVSKNGSAAATHYYLQYVLHFRDGVLLPESRVWMVPVTLSGILNGPHADEEWFSDRPIPEIVGENTKDPKLLGIENPDGAK